MEHSSADKWSTESQSSTRKASERNSAGGWDYVYLKSADDTRGRLVELQDSQERCSEVSTVLGPVGFVVPITLAVPTRLLPPGGVPVIAGNTIELGDWDLNTADSMSPATDELKAPGFAFFSVTICSNYSTQEEVHFRFAIVVGPAEERATRGAEVHCWEGRFVRRVADYTRQGGVSFLVFGRPEPMSGVQELLLLACELPPPLPGWLSDRGQAGILIRLEQLRLDPSCGQLGRGEGLPVQVRLTWDPPTGLTPNFRGPLALGRGGAASVDADGRAALLFPSAGDIRAEFLQLVPLDAAVVPVLRFRFGDSLDAAARLPQQLLLAQSPPEEEFVLCDILPVTSSSGTPAARDSGQRASIGQVSARVRRLRHARRCPAELVRSLDRCGPADCPPPGARPIIVAPMLASAGELVNASASSTTSSSCVALSYFELAIGASADGRLTSFVAGGGANVASLLCGRTNSALLGLMLRVVPNPADPPEALEAGADALLSLALQTEHWAMLVASSLRMCAVLCLKQVRLPVAMAFAGEAEATTEALEACKFYGVRAIVAPAALLAAPGAGPQLLAAAAERGLAVYACGAPGSVTPELAARLEGIFAEGTFAECRFCDAAADDGAAIVAPPTVESALPRRALGSRFV